MSKENQELYQLYLVFNRDFGKANPEAAVSRPSFEGFEYTMQRLENHPEEKAQLIRMWRQGYAATMNEMMPEIEKITRELVIGTYTIQQYMKKYEEIFMKYNGHIRFI